ncbi:cysteine-rich secretory protein 2-like [Mytilus edulis]|uniref:cysteine-rich secretory protein 2-like n=1 Tax=Mytilus edulis TaxID=6550 RepID=UPI0039F10CD5
MTDYSSLDYVPSKHFKKSIYIIGIFLLITSQNEAALNPNEINKILTTHNLYRRLFANGAYNVFVADMKKLEWSFELQERSNRMLQCDRLNALSRSPDISINIGSSLRRNYSHIIRSWFFEIRTFLPKFKTCLILNDCKRFLTLMNSKQRKVGCSAITCPINNTKTFVFMCQYEGGQDIMRPYKLGQPCSKCRGEETFCERGLCVSCSSQNQNCDCRKSCVKPGLGFGNLNSTTCTCNCEYGMGPNCDEPCQNPEQYLDYDICGSVTPENCLSDDQDERDMLAEFCPEQCVCNKAPE